MNIAADHINNGITARPIVYRRDSKNMFLTPKSIAMIVGLCVNISANSRGLSQSWRVFDASMSTKKLAPSQYNDIFE
jgi:hypothetical protein